MYVYTYTYIGLLCGSGADKYLFKYLFSTRAHVQSTRALLRKYRALLGKPYNFCSDAAIVWICRALLQSSRDLVWICRALLQSTGLFCENMGLFWGI